MDQKVRDLLAAPFAESEIRQRKGAFGAVRYVDGAVVVARLNAAFENDWSWEILEHKILETEVLVLGKLTAAGTTRMAFGGSSITRSKESNEIVSLVDDVKAACMDSLKKAASWLGIGLTQLYTDNHRSEQQRAHAPQSSTGSNGNASKNGNNGNGGNGGNGNNGAGPQNNADRITQKQLSAMWSWGRRLQMDADSIRERCKKLFGLNPEFLSKTQASELLDELGDSLGGNPV